MQNVREPVSREEVRKDFFVAPFDKEVSLPPCLSQRSKAFQTRSKLVGKGGISNVISPTDAAVSCTIQEMRRTSFWAVQILRRTAAAYILHATCPARRVSRSSLLYCTVHAMQLYRLYRSRLLAQHRLCSCGCDCSSKQL